MVLILLLVVFDERELRTQNEWRVHGEGEKGSREDVKVIDTISSGDD